MQAQKPGLDFQTLATRFPAFPKQVLLFFSINYHLYSINLVCDILAVLRQWESETLKYIPITSSIK